MKRTTAKKRKNLLTRLTKEARTAADTLARVRAEMAEPRMAKSTRR
jgi:hypothetical protein